MERGSADTPVGNSALIIKRVNNTEAPNNGVVLEYGTSTKWVGQLYIGDNATQGVYYRGWSDGVLGEWRKLGWNPVSLYDNSSGTTGTVRLSESSANFEYIEIFYGDSANGSAVNSVKVYKPNGKVVATTVCTQSGTDIRVNTRKLTISGTSITPSHQQVNFVPGGATYAVNEQLIYKVVGYR